jgi:predicted phage terminase large subunit-like protein
LNPNFSIEEKWHALAKEDYSFYCEFTHNGQYKPAKHHLLISDALERIERGDLKRLMIFMPPRHGKSQTVSETFPSWYIGRNPKKRVIAVSYGDTLSRQFGRKNRAKLQEFGELIFEVELAHDNNQTNNFSIRGNTGGALFTGIGGSVTGMGANLLIIDDPIKNRLEANSKTYRDRVWDEYQNSLLTRLTSDGAVIIINTRWHEDDLCGRILEQEADDWEIISLPAEAEDEDPLDRAPGAPLWPEFGFDREWIEKTKKSVGSQTWNALFQQRPSAQEGNIIKRAWFQFYETAPAKYDEQVISVDATFKDKDDSDFCVLQVWQKSGADKYLLDQVRARMGFTQTVQSIRTLAGKYPKAHAKLIEDKANGSAIIDFLKHEISGLIPIEPAGGKMARAYAVQPQIEAGNVYLPNPRNAPWVHDFIEECASFPQGANDDQVDCMTQALNRFQQPSGFFIGRA